MCTRAKCLVNDKVSENESRHPFPPLHHCYCQNKTQIQDQFSYLPPRHCTSPASQRLNFLLSKMQPVIPALSASWHVIRTKEDRVCESALKKTSSQDHYVYDVLVTACPFLILCLTLLKCSTCSSNAYGVLLWGSVTNAKLEYGLIKTYPRLTAYQFAQIPDIKRVGRFS